MSKIDNQILEKKLSLMLHIYERLSQDYIGKMINTYQHTVLAETFYRVLRFLNGATKLSRCDFNILNRVWTDFFSAAFYIQDICNTAKRNRYELFDEIKKLQQELIDIYLNK